MAVLEILTFRLLPTTALDDFLAADRAVQRFAYFQPGLMRRTTARADDEWTVVDLWASAEHADACDAVWGDDEATAAFTALLDPATVVVKRSTTLD